MTVKIFCFVNFLFLTSCACVVTNGNRVAEEVEEDIELAEYMGSLQRHAHKLGLAVEAKNKKLSEFYLHETEEVLEEVLEIDEHEDLPVGEAAEKIMPPLVKELAEAIHQEEWKSAPRRYEALLDGCNRCHRALEHEYIRIIPPKGRNPFNQDFSDMGK